MISVKKYPAPPVDMNEILRYMGCKEQNKEALTLAENCLSLCVNELSYSVCFDKFPITVTEDTVVFPFAKAPSSALSKNLSGYENAVVFAATVGIGLDRLILKYSRIAPSYALAFQAIGAERIEALCDTFCDDLKAGNSEISPRFSPGYSDLPLNFQSEIFKVLDCNRKIGLSLNSALLMSPSKSVTAIIGVKE